MEKTDNVKWGTSPIEQLRDLQNELEDLSTVPDILRGQCESKTAEEGAKH